MTDGLRDVNRRRRHPLAKEVRLEAGSTTRGGEVNVRAGARCCSARARAATARACRAAPSASATPSRAAARARARPSPSWTPPRWRTWSASSRSAAAGSGRAAGRAGPDSVPSNHRDCAFALAISEPVLYTSVKTCFERTSSRSERPCESKVQCLRSSCQKMNANGGARHPPSAQSWRAGWAAPGPAHQHRPRPQRELDLSAR